MKLWILGSGGMLGSALEQLCKKRGIDHFATRRLEADITQPDSLKKIIDERTPTHLINCAAYTRVDDAEKEVDLAMSVNGLGPKHLGRIASAAGIKVVHLSSDYVFDGKKEGPYTETDSCAPLSIYGKSKLLGEQNLQQELPSACIIRVSWLFGAKGKNFISSLLQFLKEKEEIKVVSDQFSRATYTLDLAEGILSLLSQEGIFHFANEGALSRAEIAREMHRVLQEEISIPLVCRSIAPVSHTVFPLPAQRPMRSVLATEKVERVLRQPIRSWKAALKDFLCLTTSS